MSKVDAQMEHLRVMEEIVSKMKSGQSLEDPEVQELLEKRDALRIKMALPKSTCGVGDMGELTPGTRLEIIEPSDECGETMRKVRVLQGKSNGLIGCVSIEDIASTQQ